MATAFQVISEEPGARGGHVACPRPHQCTSRRASRQGRVPSPRPPPALGRWVSGMGGAVPPRPCREGRPALRQPRGEVGRRGASRTTRSPGGRRRPREDGPGRRAAGSLGGRSGCPVPRPPAAVVRSAHPSPRGALTRPASGSRRALYPVSARPRLRRHYRRRDAVPVPLRVPGLQPLALRLPEGTARPGRGGGAKPAGGQAGCWGQRRARRPGRAPRAPGRGGRGLGGPGSFGGARGSSPSRGGGAPAPAAPHPPAGLRSGLEPRPPRPDTQSRGGAAASPRRGPGARPPLRRGRGSPPCRRKPRCWAGPARVLIEARGSREAPAPAELGVWAEGDKLSLLLLPRVTPAMSSFSTGELPSRETVPAW